jgi:hypothetical protein
MTFAIKQHDRRPAFTSTLEAPADTPIDLTGCTAKFIMSLNVTPFTLKVNAAATIISPTAGTVAYSWGATDTDTVALYRAEWEITYGDGTKMTVPGGSYLYINVVADLA